MNQSRSNHKGTFAGGVDNQIRGKKSEFFETNHLMWHALHVLKGRDDIPEPSMVKDYHAYDDYHKPRN